MLLWKYDMEDHWAITHPDHPRPESISIGQDECVTVLPSSLLLLPVPSTAVSWLE
jgi:hypothetical protein